MKGKGIVLSLAICIMACLFVTKAHGQGAWHDCTVGMAGLGGGAFYIMLTDTATQINKWCKPREGQERDMLAVALAALANNKLVRAHYDAAQQTPVIMNLYCTPD